MFSIYGMIRKLLMVLIFVIFDNYPYFQISFLTVLSVINWAYITSEKPFKTIKDQRLEFFGEMVIYTIIWSNMCFQVAATAKMRSEMGTVHIILYLVLVFTSIGFNCLDLP